MNAAEILEFLELSPHSTDTDIQRRALEKKFFFEQLKLSAPNTVLKNLYAKNLEKTKEILSLLNVNIDAVDGASGRVPPNPSLASQNEKGDSILKTHPKTVAWLIRHTEMFSTRSFPLFEGVNVVGRQRHPHYTTILLEEDEYISRYHAKLEIISSPKMQIYISDGLDKPSKNGVFINANVAPLSSKIKLQGNDTIQIGMTKLVLKINENINLRRLENEIEESEYMKTVIINL